MSTSVNFVKPFTNPEMISRKQFALLVGGKVYDKSEPKGYKGYYGLLNQLVEAGLFDRNAKVTDHEKSPTYGYIFDYTSAINSKTGVPFRQWTNLFNLNSKQAAWVIKHMLELVKQIETETKVPATPVVPAQDHQMVFSDEVQPVSKSPEKDGLPEGRYHLEGSDGYYVKVTKSEKNGRYYVTLEY